MKLTFIFFISLIITANSQSNIINNKDILKWFDNQIGIENTGLYNGVEYFPKYFVINDKHPFFDTLEPVEASIIYDDQLYDNIQLRYNVYSDELLLQVNKAVSVTSLQLIKNKVIEFSMLKKNFKNVDNLKVSNTAVGFCEVLYDSKIFTIFKKHQKRIIKKFDKSVVYHEFKKRKSDFFLMYENKLQTLNSPKDVSRIFPNLKKEINHYIKKNLRKTNRNESYPLLLGHVEELLLKKVNQTI